MLRLIMQVSTSFQVQATMILCCVYELGAKKEPLE